VLPAVARDTRHLLLHLDGLRRLADLVEGAREQPQSVEVARVRLKADLQLGQGLHPVVAPPRAR
jgi:hypothetical protein